jgi:hypothetical protein
LRILVIALVLFAVYASVTILALVAKQAAKAGASSAVCLSRVDTRCGLGDGGAGGGRRFNAGGRRWRRREERERFRRG